MRSSDVYRTMIANFEGCLASSGSRSGLIIVLTWYAISARFSSSNPTLPTISLACTQWRGPAVGLSSVLSCLVRSLVLIYRGPRSHARWDPTAYCSMPASLQRKGCAGSPPAVGTARGRRRAPRDTQYATHLARTCKHAACHVRQAACGMPVCHAACGMHHEARACDLPDMPFSTRHATCRQAAVSPGPSLGPCHTNEAPAARRPLNPPPCLCPWRRPRRRARLLRTNRA
jgi:hypothetical protein